MTTAMVTFNGRITLPSDVRKELGLRTGDSVDFVEIEKGRFAITPRTGSMPAPDEGQDGWIQRPSFSTADEAEENRL
jgi:AbrB family looped-hinge helix DNA binding protein